MKISPVLLVFALVGTTGLLGCSKKKEIVDFSSLTNYANSHLKTISDITPENTIEKIAKISYQKPEFVKRSNASISRNVSQEKYDESNYFESIVAECEGFRPSFYDDVGSGFAIGFGWNAGLQSKETNKRFAQAINEKPEPFILVSGMKTTQTPPTVHITVNQALTAVGLMRNQFEQNWLSVKGYSTLSANEKATLAYHQYKIGPSLAKYPTLLNYVKAYIADRSRANALLVASQFHYKYKLNGVYKEDTRSVAYLSALFLDPKAFGFLINKNAAPVEMKDYQFVKDFHIDVGNPVAQVQDSLGDNLMQLEEQQAKPTIILYGPLDSTIPITHPETDAEFIKRLFHGR